MSADVVYQASDLNGKLRTNFIADGRRGIARLRHTDGTSLVLVPEHRLAVSEHLNALASLLLLLLHLSRQEGRVEPRALGEYSWLRSFDAEDLGEFAAELGDALAASNLEDGTAVADEAVRAWRVTARQLEDPLRRAVLVGDERRGALVDAPRPEGTVDETRNPDTEPAAGPVVGV